MARLIESVVGHTQAIENLYKLKASNRWPHAFLFVGPDSIGKKKIALAFSQMLVCTQSETACGLCGPCLRMEKEQSENLLKISPDTTMAKPVIKVEAIRQVLDSLSLSSWGGARIVMIDQAQRMNPQAANALLKSLEEPADNVYFFLMGSDSQQFLPTIQSRCQVNRFHSLSVTEQKKIMPQLPDWAYLASRGQMDRLQQLTSKEGTERRHEAQQLLEQFIFNAEFLRNADWRSQIKDKSWTLFTIMTWLQILLTTLTSKATEKPQTDSSKLSQITGEKLLRFSADLVRAENEILANSDPVLIFETMWVQHARMG